VSGRESAARRLRVKGRRGPGRCGNSRDRTRKPATIRACARVPPSDGRHLGSKSWPHLHGGVGEAVSAASGRAVRALKARTQGDLEWGSDRGVRGTAGRKCEEEERPAPTRSGPPKRIGRRETPGPPVSWSWVQVHWPRARRKPRRDAGSERGAGARSRVVGSRSRSVRIVVQLRGTSQGKP
jgi:hypothetical protein